MCKLRANMCRRRCGRLHHIHEIWHCQGFYNTKYCANWNIDRMIQVPSAEICDCCCEQRRQERKIEMAVAEAFLREHGEKRRWTKVRWVTERNEFRRNFEKKVRMLDCY